MKFKFAVLSILLIAIFYVTIIIYKDSIRRDEESKERSSKDSLKMVNQEERFNLTLDTLSNNYYLVNKKDLKLIEYVREHTKQTKSTNQGKIGIQTGF